MIIAMLLAAQTAPLPDIRLEEQGGQRYRFVIAEPITTEQADAAMVEMSRQATALCRALSVRWGKYTFSRKADLATGEVLLADYVQGVSCFDPATDPYKPVAADWKPGAEDQRRANAFVLAYLGAMDASDMPAVVGMLEPALEMTVETMKPHVDDFRLRVAVRGREIGELVWLNNPENFNHPGAYALAPVSGPRSCGYVVLYRTLSGTYQVSKQEFAGLPDGKPVTAEDEAALSEQCASM